MKLHPITWLMVVLATVETAAAIITFTDGARQLSLGVLGVFGENVTGGWGPFIARSIPTFTYALGWFGLAATVEFLYRIWRELQSRRSSLTG
jgi:hypothetical protein